MFKKSRDLIFYGKHLIDDVFSREVDRLYGNSVYQWEVEKVSMRINETHIQ